ncbi:RimK/LysX family protein [Candidatus Saccharibacteria bacterium]|nr:RimK/LysX family protein [Candidatus Saccharibacteria bacterium]
MKKVIGSFEKISFPGFGVFNVIAKVDTGATSGSLHATHIKEITLSTGEKAVRFRAYGAKPSVTISSYKYKWVRSSNGVSAMRYVVPTLIVIKGVHYPIEVSLADRTLMKKGVLIGSRFLRSHGFIVDVKRGTKYRGEVKQ